MKLIPYVNQATLSGRSLDDFDRLISAFWGEPTPVTAWAPRLDVHEDKDAYTIEADLPGVEKKDVELSVEDGVLTIRGTRKDTREEKGKDGWHRLERHYGSFERSLSLGEGVDVEHVKAEMKDGVLHLTLPKKEQAKPRRIEVK